MSAYSQSFYRAILVPDWRIDGLTPWAAQSSYTQAGAHPGVPVFGSQASDFSQMTLEASGEYVSTTTPNLTIRVTKPGHATRTGAGACIAWESQAGDVYGWDRPGTVNGQDVLGTGAATNYGRSPHLVTIPSTGTVLCAYHVIQHNTAPPGTYSVEVRKRAATTGVWATAVVVTATAPAAPGLTDFSVASATNVSALAGPCMVVLPLGRVLLFCVVEDVVANVAAVWMYFTDDEGATWWLGSRTCLPAVIDTATYTIRRIRAAYLDGSICLLLHRATTASGPSDVIIQYASDDMGGSFKDLGDGTLAGLPEVITVGNRLVVAYVPRSGQTNAQYPCWSVLGSAWSPLEAEYVETAGTNISVSDFAASLDGNNNIDVPSKLALCQDERGIVYAYWGATGNLFGAMQDGTLAGIVGTWERIDMATAIATFAAGDYIREVTATFQRGRVILAGSNTASTGTNDGYIGVWYLGGYTTVELPGKSLTLAGYLSDTSPAFVSASMAWMPFEVPANTGWTGAGVATEALTVSGTDWFLHITTVADSRTYTVTPTAQARQLGHWVFRSNDSDYAQGILRASGGGGGADDYTLVVIANDTTITMKDGATVRQTAAHGIAEWIEVLAAVSTAGVGSVWYRAYTGANDARKWTLLGDAETITAASSGTTNLVRWGCEDGVAANYDVDFMFFDYSTNALGNGHDLASGAGNLNGRPISGDPIYLTNGVWLRATGGPAIGGHTGTGDAWTITPRYDYPVANLDPRLSSSPRDGWRSTQIANDESIAYELDPDGDARMPTDLLGVHLEGINHPKWLLQTHDGSSWTTRLTLTAYAAVAWVREAGSVMIRYTSGGFTGVIREDELVGGAFMFGTTSAADIRRITRNTVGTVQSSGVTRLPRIYCSDIDNTEGSSGTGYIWFPRVSGVYPISGGDLVEGLRLVADVDATFLGPPEGYFACGQAVIGSVYLLGFDPDASRRVDTEANTEIVEDRSGRRRARVRGPVRHTVDVSWSMVDQRPLFASTGDDYIVSDASTVISDGSNNPVLAMRHDVAQVIPGLVEHTDGRAVPVVYLPKIAATGAQVLLQGSVYGRGADEVTVSTILGDEFESELVRFDWSIEEEV